MKNDNDWVIGLGPGYLAPKGKFTMVLEKARRFHYKKDAQNVAKEYNDRFLNLHIFRQKDWRVFEMRNPHLLGVEFLNEE